MATITRTLSAKRGADGRSQVMLRLSVTRSLQLRLRSGLYCRPEDWSVSRGRPQRRRGRSAEGGEVQALEVALEQLDVLLTALANEFGGQLTKDVAQAAIDTWHRGEEEPETDSVDFFAAVEAVISTAHGSKVDHLRMVGRTVWRWSIHAGRQPLDAAAMTEADVRAIADYYMAEAQLLDAYTPAMLDYPPCLQAQTNQLRPHPRSLNSRAKLMGYLASFFTELRRREIVSNDPLRTVRREGELYGRPWFLTVEERRRLSSLMLADPLLDAARDCFVFQCLTGCRVSDLRAITAADILEGQILEYIPRKTGHRRADAVRVPLNAEAAAIAAKWAERRPSGPLFPFPTSRHGAPMPGYYTERLRTLCRLAGLDRRVMVLDPLTRRAEHRPIYEVASSHLGRRTFVGNLYRRVKDQSLIGAMSGHTPGSRSFRRYADIDDDIRRDVISLL